MPANNECGGDSLRERKAPRSLGVWPSSILDFLYTFHVVPISYGPIVWDMHIDEERLTCTRQSCKPSRSTSPFSLRSRRPRRLQVVGPPLELPLYLYSPAAQRLRGRDFSHVLRHSRSPFSRTFLRGSYEGIGPWFQYLLACHWKYSLPLLEDLPGVALQVFDSARAPEIRTRKKIAYLSIAYKSSLGNLYRLRRG